MEQKTEQPITGELVELALRDLDEGNEELLREALTELHPAETANLLEGMPPGQRSATWDLVEDGFDIISATQSIEISHLTDCQDQCITLPNFFTFWFEFWTETSIFIEDRYYINYFESCNLTIFSHDAIGAFSKEELDALFQGLLDLKI